MRSRQAAVCAEAIVSGKFTCFNITAPNKAAQGIMLISCKAASGPLAAALTRACSANLPGNAAKEAVLTSNRWC